MARCYPYNPSSKALLKPALDTTFFEDWRDEDTTNFPLLCAEMSRLAYAGRAVVTDALESIGFRVVGFLGEASVAVSLQARGTQGFVATHPTKHITVLAFRGTESGKFADLITDANTLQTEYGNHRVHAGFVAAYLAAKQPVGDLLHGHVDNLLMTGHSLGAALATLAALDFPTAKLINFGSPLVGDAGFAAQFIDREVARYVHCCDVITRVPLPRFDRQHIMGLFSELGDFHNLNVPRKMAAEVLTTPVALALDLGFRLVVPPVHFQHVAPAKYIRADGEMASEVEASDQQRARTSYTKSHGATWDQLKKLIKAASAPDSAPNASLATRGLRQFIGQLFDLAMDAPVRLRDLADHAPINYVSAFSGRL